MTKISATVVADSINEAGDRLTSLIVVMPRYILAEFNTHRMLSRNSASSRAIPFEKMIKSVKDDPFIPIAWQEDHSGMQGTKYLNESASQDCINDWRKSAEIAVERALVLASRKTTKQLINRGLEAYMYHTVLVSATEWENFFAQRCPQYPIPGMKTDKEGNSVDTVTYERSKKDYIETMNHLSNMQIMNPDAIDWFDINKGQADIHMMATAEAIWDAKNASTPKLLRGGEWHIIFEDKIDMDKIQEWINGDIKSNGYETIGKDTLVGRVANSWPDTIKIKVATAMAARISYTTVGDEKEVSIAKYLEIHDKLINANPIHASPMEHIAQAMYRDQYEGFIKRELIQGVNTTEPRWCGNFRGFIQYRKMLANENILTKR